LTKGNEQQFLVAGRLVRGNIAESSSFRPFRCGWLAQTEALTKNNEDFTNKNFGRSDPTRPLLNMVHDR
jgi:hypothetical protein